MEGDKVNLEVDVLGKYVERSLSSVLDRLGSLEDWTKVNPVAAFCALTPAERSPEPLPTLLG